MKWEQGMEEAGEEVGEGCNVSQSRSDILLLYG